MHSTHDSRLAAALRAAGLAGLLVLATAAAAHAATRKSADAATPAEVPPPPGASGPKLGTLGADELATWQRLCFRTEDAFDSTAGGFVSRAGYPDESAIDLGFILGRRDGMQRWRGHSLYTTQWMLGLEDSVGGGFYARHEREAANAFDRPTALNARRLENLADAWLATNDTRYWVTAVRLLEFAERNVVDGRGGFTSDPVGDQDLLPDVNGIAIHAWLRWWAAGRDPKRRDFALKTIDRLWTQSWSDSFGFVRTNSFGDLLAWPRLSDQVEMGRAMVLSARLAGRAVDLMRAKRVAEVMLAQFADERGALRSEAPIHKGRASSRGPRVPRENARAALFLCELAHVSGEGRWIDSARRIWRAFPKEADKTRLEAAEWALAYDAAIAPTFPRRPADAPIPNVRGKSPRTNDRRPPGAENKLGGASSSGNN